MDKVVFTEGHIAQIAHFDFGEERWGQEAAVWIKSRPDSVADCALGWMAKPKTETEVWLYRDAGQWLGFGSLGRTKWPLPGPNDPKVPISIIPWIAVHRDYWHKPACVERQQRYSWQIMRDLITAARKKKDRNPLLSLVFHRENTKAAEFYKLLRFVDYGDPYFDGDVEYQKMILRLDEAVPSATNAQQTEANG